MPQTFLTLSAGDRQQLERLGRLLTPHADRLVADLVADFQDVAELASLLPPGDLAAQLRPGLDDYLAALRDDRSDAYMETARQRIRQQAEQGVPYEGLVAAILVFQNLVARLLLEIVADAGISSALSGPFLKFGHIHLLVVALAYIGGKEELIRAQQEAMLELSTPVVEVWQGVLALPLVGTIDTSRAKQITQNLLRTIRDEEARVVIIDISGVPLVDTKVANHLMKTVRAARLLGARGIIVGISPEIADTLINLDIGLEGIETYFSLRQGLAAALDSLHLAVVPREARP